MDFNIEEIKKAEFIGFKTINELVRNTTLIPKIKGVYLILNSNHEKVEYLATGSGGYFKGKDPNVSVPELENNWVDNSQVMYIGKAGTKTGKATLNSRLKQYLAFGQGKKTGHWGGRMIWQLKNSGDLIVCWKALSSEVLPWNYERELLVDFFSQHSKLPFANLSK